MNAEAASDPSRNHRSSSDGPFPVRLRLLGGFGVWVGSRAVSEGAWHLRKAKSLMKLLALAPGHRLHREQVMEALWPELEMHKASNNLHQSLHAARRALKPSAPASSSATTASSGYLLLRDKQLTLCPESPLWVDVEAFEEAAATARYTLEPAAYRAAIDLYSGELLPQDRYEAWAEQRRAELRGLYLALLLEVGALYEERKEFEPAIEALSRVVGEDPTHEGAHVGLMRLHALLGRRTEALRHYERLRDALFREFGTEPEAAATRLREEIWAGTFPHSDSPPADILSQEEDALSPAGGAAMKHNLPLARTSFIGRERETLEVKRLLAMARLLTLTGAGGCGKTRLALKVASDLVGAYPDGAWLVDLAPLSDPTLVAQAVAQALSVREQPGRALLKTLEDTLRMKKMLLVLDNCEHLIEAVVRLVDALLDSCPDLRILASSRERLDTAGEVNWLVPSLTVPDARGPSTSQALEAYESVRLFLERARQRDPSFVLSVPNAQAISQVCRRLEGIPLAIELAAGRMGVLSAQQLSERLDDYLKVLSRGSQTTDPRHRSMRATLEWSHDLLSEPERVLFRRLAVFAGGWTLEAAEEVCTGEEIEEGEVLDVLSELVERSLVVTEAGHEEVPRFRMLEPIRQYGRELLEESREAETTKRTHAEYFLALAEQAEPKLWGPEDALWLDRLEREHDNMRAALSWSMEHDEVELALRLGGALRWFWYIAGYYGEGRTWLEAALTKDTWAPAEARIKALAGVGWLVVDQGDLDRAEEAAEEGLMLSTQAGNRREVAADLKNLLGELARSRGDLERAARLSEESLALYQEAGDKPGIVWALGSLANVAGDRGDHELAKELYEEGLALAKDLGGSELLGVHLISLGDEYMLEGNLERATELNEEAADLFRQQGRRGGLQYALDNLGWAALLRGEYDKARTLHKESLALCLELGDKQIGPESLEGLACSAASNGEGERAARLYGAAEALREAVGYRLSPRARALREPFLQAARSRLAEAAWEKAFTEGRTMRMEEAVEYALSAAEEEHEPPTLVPVPEQQPPPPDEPTERLTPREQEVALLVGRGLTNRQIASELSISEHTAANHVRKILKKLKLRSRAQISSS